MAQFLKKSAVMLRRSVVQKARVPVSVLRPNGYLEGELKEMFEEWMIQHKKSYHSLEEKDKRFQKYKNAVRESENYSPYYTPRINSFADMDMAEIAALNNESDDEIPGSRWLPYLTLAI